jgi:hypothetical protein
MAAMDLEELTDFPVIHCDCGASGCFEADLAAHMKSPDVSKNAT